MVTTTQHLTTMTADVMVTRREVEITAETTTTTEDAVSTALVGAAETRAEIWAKTESGSGTTVQAVVMASKNPAVVFMTLPEVPGIEEMVEIRGLAVGTEEEEEEEEEEEGNVGGRDVGAKGAGIDLERALPTVLLYFYCSPGDDPWCVLLVSWYVGMIASGYRMYADILYHWIICSCVEKTREQCIQCSVLLLYHTVRYCTVRYSWTGCRFPSR